jgi:DMSO/TMAO reductase YedYZ molybdopterin-dependent catalytic subunit
MKRRGVMAGLSALFLGACSKIADTRIGGSALSAPEDWQRMAQRFFNGDDALVKEYNRSEISPTFRGNGSTNPQDAAYRAHAANGFADWRLAVGGLVEKPLVLNLEDIRRLPQRSQITRHDCVEGWSAIGEWTGPQLGHVLRMAGVRDEVRYIVFHCADTLNGSPYYESVDLADAFHPQTIIAHMLNRSPLPVKNGAPLRMRIERQLGYKHAKYVHSIEAVASLEGIGKGNGGYWEDRGYQWYAGA